MSAQVTDVNGNQATASQAVTVAETGPTLTIAAVDGNNVINAAEAHAAGGVPLSGTVSGIAANSTFTVTVTDNGVTHRLTATVNAAGTSWSATIPSSDATALANGTATVSAQVTDVNGNVATASQAVTVAETGPTLTIAAVDGNNVINNAEAHAAGGVPLSGTVSGIAANSTFTVTVTDNGVTHRLHGDGERGRHQLERDDPLERCHGAGQWHGDGLGAGHRRQRQPGDGEPGRDGGRDRPDADDCRGRRQQRHQRAEAHAAGGVPLSGTVSGIAANSTFTVTVTDNGVTQDYTATVNAAGTSWSATIPSSDATALANGTATVSAQVTDVNGNPATASQAVTVAETGPTLTIAAVDGNNVINDAEAHAAGGVPLSGTVSGIAANSTFTVTVTDNGVTHRLHGDGECGRHHLERDDPLERCHAPGQRHGDGVGAGHRCQRQPGDGQPDRDGGRDRPDADDCRGRRQQRHQRCRGARRRRGALSGTVSGIAANSTFTVTVTDNGVTHRLHARR